MQHIEMRPGAAVARRAERIALDLERVARFLGDTPLKQSMMDVAKYFRELAEEEAREEGDDAADQN